MPSFGSQNSVPSTPENIGGASYTKILAIVSKNSGSTTVFDKSHKVEIGLKTDATFTAQLQSMPSGNFQRAAGQDLASLFYPYQTSVGSGYDLPSFNYNVVASGVAGSGIALYNLLPFKWGKDESSKIYDRWAVPSGQADSFKTMLSGKRYNGDSDRYRNISEIRGIGLRLPAMGVGWGYDTSGRPFPSGGASGPSSGVGFIGNHEHGYQVDPSQYIAAPIDFRYDSKRNVWTSPEAGFWAEITNMDSELMGGTLIPFYSWIEKELSPSGYMVKTNPIRYGTSETYPGHEVNLNTTVESGAHVWMVASPDGQRMAFFYPIEILPSGQYVWMSYTMVSQNQPGWDFIRSHSLL